VATQAMKKEVSLPIWLQPKNGKKKKKTLVVQTKNVNKILFPSLLFIIIFELDNFFC
jgi:hypothetical protein